MPTGESASGTSTAGRLVSRLLAAAKEIRVAEVRIGLGYTAVMLTDGRTGVAFTFRDLARGGCSVFHGIRPLAGRPAADLLPLLESPDVIEAAVGLACANALANRDGQAYLGGDILEQLELRPEDHVGMVGHFGPLVDTIRQRARSLTVFERITEPSGMLHPQQEALDVLPGCQIALITATAILNRTIDGLLAAARSCREVVLLGASTPLLAEAFHPARVTMLSGVVVEEPAQLLRVVSEGGGMREFSRYIRKVTVRAGTVELGPEAAHHHAEQGQ